MPQFFRPVGGIGKALKAFTPMLVDYRFYAAQALTIAISLAHFLLETRGEVTSDLVDFLPVTLFWIPLMFASIRFGLKGSMATSIVVILSSIPDWLYRQRMVTLPQEFFMVSIAITISLLVGHQSDRRTEAQNKARIYATSTTMLLEEEEKRLSLALHDEPIQVLISVCHQIDSLKAKDRPFAGELADIRATLTSVIEVLRDLSVELHYPALDDIGAVSAIHELLGGSSRRAGFEGRMNVSGKEPALDADIKAALFRIAREALRNVETHASAGRVDVAITFSDHRVTLDIVDDGTGFDPASLKDRASYRNHLGILSMEERAEMLGGWLEVSSSPGHGTRVTAVIPVSPDSRVL